MCTEIDIPVNTNDNKAARMNKFVAYVLKQLSSGDYARVCDYADGNHDEAPGISYEEARELADKFIAKGYHASAYYITHPAHGFRFVTISRYVRTNSSARFSYTEVWG